MTNTKRIINDWAPETRSLLGRLVDAGFKVVSGHNGEDKFRYDERRPHDFVANLIACDESHLFVKSPAGKKIWLYLVLGNSPGEIVADCSTGEDEALESVLDKHADEWEGKPQPTKDEV